MTATKYYDVKTFTSARSVGYLLKMAHSLIHDGAVAAFAGHDVSFMQWLVLMKLREGVWMTASDLGRQMRHDSGALTRLIDQLDERGFIRRERSEEDRRVVRLQLTAEGSRKVMELMPIAVERLNHLLSDFSKAEFVELTRLLTKLVASLQATEQADAAGGVL